MDLIDRGSFFFFRAGVLRAGILVFGLVAHATPAAASCCNLIKIDPESPRTTIRACSAAVDATCDEVLFVGVLELGQTRSVCADGGKIVYAEFDDDEDVFGDYVEAVCENDVEF